MTDNESVVHIHYGILFTCEENEIMKFAGEWMEQDMIILSKVT